MNEAPLPPLPDTSTNAMVVGIGASAGGLKPLLDFFESASTTAGVAYVVVMHLSPEHASRIPDVLQQATRMPVEQVTRSVEIERDHVYVISPKSLLRIYDGKLEASESEKRQGTAMTIDLFLETLANAHGGRAVGVVLSGSGFDGTRGVRAIKANGGITIAQAPEEAEYDSMPRSAIGSGAVDFVLPAREMPPKIEALWRNAQAIKIPTLPDRPNPEEARAEAEEAVHDILAMVRSRTGHDFSQYKRATLMRRLERRLQVNQLQNIGEYRRFIADYPNEANALLRDLLINVTWFFRDPAAWQVLDDRALSELLAEQAGGGSLRIWIVGCATGEEAYSVGMLLLDRMQQMYDPPAVTIFATDIDEESLAFARAGRYPESIAEHVTQERLRRYFVREHGRYQVQKNLREMMMFAQHNAIQDPPFSRLDLVICRNLLIYLTRHAQSKLLDLLHFSLKPDRYLFLGMSESVDDGHDGFAVIDKTMRIYAQQPRARMGMMLTSLPMLQPRNHANDLAVGGKAQVVSFSQLHQRLLEHYAPPSVVVDDRFEIVHLSDRAGHFLQLGPGEPSLNLLKVVPESLRYDVKASLEMAMETMRTVRRTNLPFTRGPEIMYADINVHPVRDKASGRTFALMIIDEAEVAGGKVDEVEQGEKHALTLQTEETRKLEERVRDMEAQLRASIEQFEVQNEELQASNEELQATNEELRATTEELETGKEELQSINEELVTVNQELKNKVDETMRISDDLTNFVTGTEIAALFVDRDLRLMRYTPFASGIFNVIATDIGRPLSDITHRLEGIDLTENIRTVYESLTMVEREVKTNDDRWYIVRFLPYRTVDDRIRGAVLTLLEITGRKRAEAVGRRTEAWARVIADGVREYAIITLDASGRVQSWSPGACDIFGYEAEEMIGDDLSRLFTPEDRDAGVPQSEMSRAREHGRADDNRWQMRKDGSRFFASGILAAVDAPDAYGYVKVLRDLTTQKRFEEHQQRLLEAERTSRSAAEDTNRMKDEFLAMLSHELRNPLSLMLMQAEILQRAPEAKKSDRLRRAANVIHEMVRAQAQLVEDMVDMSRARTGKLTIDRQLLPLTFVIAESIGALRREAKQKDITLEVQTDDVSLLVEADPTRVRQIAWNLLSNALKFTPSGGHIGVRVVRDDDYARLDVEDTGQGIAPEIMPYIFDWFRRSEIGTFERHGGMGIGLALVRQLVELHNGRVEAYSEGTGRGARFSVWLPLQMASTPDERRASPETHERRLDGVRVLVVDDSTANGEALRDLLVFEGAEVTIESAAAKAIEAAGRERFDLIISDITMPDIDGYAMVRAIRRTGPNNKTPAIAYSGYSGSAEIERARAAGFDLHLTKPIDVGRLVEAIERVTRRQQPAD